MCLSLDTIFVMPWVFFLSPCLLSQHMLIPYVQLYNFKYILWNLECLYFSVAKYFILQIALTYKSTWEFKWWSKIHVLLIENESDFLFGDYYFLLIPGRLFLYFLSLTAQVDLFEKWVFAKSSLSWKGRSAGRVIT